MLVAFACEAQNALRPIIVANSSETGQSVAPSGLIQGPTLSGTFSPGTLLDADESPTFTTIATITDNENTSEWIPIPRYSSVATYKDTAYFVYPEETTRRVIVGSVHVNGGAVNTQYLDKVNTSWGLRDDDHHFPATDRDWETK